LSVSGKRQALSFAAMLLKTAFCSTPADSGGREQDAIVQQLNILPVANPATWRHSSDLIMEFLQFSYSNPDQALMRIDKQLD